MVELSQARLKELFSYCPKSGQFTRRVTRGRHGRWQAGTVAGGVRSDGYLNIRIDGKMWLSHRLAFLYMAGAVPKEVDHIDRDRANNVWPNLRACSPFQNRGNVPKYRNNKSGFKGVCWSERDKKYRATINAKGKQFGLGYFDTPEEASAAYERTAKLIFGEFTCVESS